MNPTFIIEDSKPKKGSIKKLAYSSGVSAGSTYRQQRVERGIPSFRRTIPVTVIPQFRGQQITTPIPTVQSTNSSQPAPAPSSFQVTQQINTIRWPNTGKPLLQ